MQLCVLHRSFSLFYLDICNLIFYYISQTYCSKNEELYVELKFIFYVFLIRKTYLNNWNAWEKMWKNNSINACYVSLFWREMECVLKA